VAANEQISALSASDAREALTLLEEGSIPPDRLTLMTLAPAEAFSAVQAYLDAVRLSAAPDGDVGRAAGYHRVKGMREVLLLIVDELARVEPESTVAEGLERVLFNSGVRRFGVVGETVEFSPRLHHPA